MDGPSRPQGKARWGRAILLVVIASMLAAHRPSGALAASPGEKLVLTGIVTAISQVAAPSRSPRNWAVTVHVVKIRAGEYSEPELTFTVHSPARAGLAVGDRYTIEATWNGHEYVVDETRPMKKERARP